MHTKRRQSGEIATAVLIVCGLLGATQLVPNWRITNWGKPKPPTKELAQAQADLAKARDEAKRAQMELDQARAEREARKNALSQSGQQLVAGIPEALKDEPRTVGVVLATSLATRASDRLAAALGDLPEDKRREIMDIVAEAKSQDAERIADAERRLAAKDAEARMLAQEKASLESKLPVLESRLQASESKVMERTQTEAKLTAKVTEYAQKAYEREREAGSLGATLDKLWWVLGALGIAYAVVHFVLPSMAQEFPASRLLQTLNKTAKSVTSAHL